MNLVLQREAGAAARAGRRPGEMPVDELIQMLPADE